MKYLLKTIVIFFLFSIVLHSSETSYQKKLEQIYKRTYLSYKRLKTKKIKNKRSYSTKIIESFYKIYKYSKKRKLRAWSLFFIGKTYYYLCDYYDTEIFADLAISSFERLCKEFKESSLCDDSKYYNAKIFYYQKNIPNLAASELVDILNNYPNGDMVKDAKFFLYKIFKKYPRFKDIYKIKSKEKTKNISISKKIIPRGFATFKRIRTFTMGKFSRVVFDFDKLPKFKIKYDEREVDIFLKKVAKDSKFKIISLNKKKLPGKINCNFDYSKTDALISLEMNINFSLKYYTLHNPERLVFDFEEKKKQILSKPKKYIKFKDKETIKTIVIDAGHGGKDPGAIYYGLKEKDVTLKIAKYLYKELKRRLRKDKYKILMTRTRDVFIPLNRRARFANRNKADLFISIHINASKRRKTYGFETYYLNVSYARAPKIRATTQQREVDYIIADLMRTAKLEESYELARYIQRYLISNLRKRYTRINDLGVKPAPFYVLMGTKMPAVLVENSFISNRMENKRLRDSRYLKIVAKSIADGIIRYIENERFIKK